MRFRFLDATEWFLSFFNCSELDNRLKRRSEVLPGPKINEVPIKKQKLTPTKQKAENSMTKTITINDAGVRLATPTLGTAGPIVRHAGKFRVQVKRWCFKFVIVFFNIWFIADFKQRLQYTVREVDEDTTVTRKFSIERSHLGELLGFSV
jgi:hypothetical protein